MSVITLRAVIFDWAGTIVDHGCFAPVAVFGEVFRRRGVALSSKQVRGPMGLAKRDHISALVALPEVAAAWIAANGRPCTEADIDAMYAETIPLQSRAAVEHAALVPGALEAVAACRALGLRVGSTTGYSRAMMADLVPIAARLGYIPDALCCADEVPAGRPAPWMALRVAEALGTYPPAAIVKVGDTVPDIGEGRNAGMWAVGVTLTGNEPGIDAAAAAGLSPADREALTAPIAAKLLAAGAHLIIPSVAELPAALEVIAARLARGERPI